ncbi:alpha-galactosidase [Streptomyces sp. NPDC091280]|uniref:alpha-galactosidase n=1 Tax=Streptomyces sp. NPDC091280 TaxID=3365984 RepID=UPI0038132DC3
MQRLEVHDAARPAGAPRRPGHIDLRAGGVQLVLDTSRDVLPSVLHWGADLGTLTDADIEQLRQASVIPDVLAPVQGDYVVSLLPEPSSGWVGTPGVSGHRDGADFSTRFVTTAVQVTTLQSDAVIAHRVLIEARDAVSALGLALEIEMAHSGLLRLRASVTNTGNGVYDVLGVDLALPVPEVATELLDLAGRWARERAQQRSPFTHGTHLRESRRAAGHDASTVLAAGTAGFGHRAGEVYAIHLGWSGHSRMLAERNSTGAALLAAGELLLPGEVRLAHGEDYTSPWLYASYGIGTDEMAGRFHDFLRSRPQHPKSPRPVTLNVWEAVYFDHSLTRLTELAAIAADVGVERFVLDDGWFRHRRNDTAGLGDWFVDEDVWPHGLTPLIDRVQALGMQFGLWFEPEMINEDSDLARAHPEWIMGPGERLPLPRRHQQVLNLAIPECYQWIRDRMHALLTEYPIDYVKWDHNRPLIEAGDRRTRRASVHQQTLAVYQLVDELRELHPGLEIESCASGGGRIDLGMMQHADRVWASDCIDPLERQLIEEGTALLLPPEMVGSHVASPLSHTTGRSHSLDFRAANAFFSHMGVEWDLTSAAPAERQHLAEWITAHKRHRPLLHTGRVVQSDQPDPAYRVRGVVAKDGGEAIYAVVALRTAMTAAPGRVRLPGLDPATRYEVTPLAPGDTLGGRTGDDGLAWWQHGLTLPGTVISRVGIQGPALNPEQSALIHVRRLQDSDLHADHREA